MYLRRLLDRVTRRLCPHVRSGVCPSVGDESRASSALGQPDDDSAAGSDPFPPAASREDAILRFVVDSFPLDNVTWQSYYLSVAGVGLAFFIAQFLHVGVVSALDPVLPTIALMGLLSLGGLYQLYTRVVYVAPPP